jgi:signal transduction histidine kinase
MHLNNLVVDVTQFSREKVLAVSPVDLTDLVESSFELVMDKLHEKGTVARKTYAPQPIISQWDEDQLRQVFVNLLGNAIDASPPNSVIEVSTDLVQTNHSRKPGGRDFSVNGASELARIKITDHGKGMSEETLARIFEPFFTTKRRGTGLGLAVVKKIIELHHGNIHVQSKIDKGTTFTIDIPLAPASSSSN